MGPIAAYGAGWDALKANFWILVGIALLVALIAAPADALSDASAKPGYGWLALLAAAYGLLVTGPVYFGAAWVYLKGARGERPELADLFAGFRDYANVVLATLLIWLIIVGGLLLLVVPGIYFACRLAFTAYLVMERGMGATEAIRESWRMTRGNTLTIFLMGLLAIPIAFVGVLLLIVGIFVAIAWIGSSFASLYDTLSQSAPAS